MANLHAAFLSAVRPVVARSFLAFLTAGAVLLAAACDRAAPGSGPAPAAGAPDVLTVVATTGMVADLAREVAGPHAQVTVLMGEGVDPHLYKASPSDIRALEGADLILYSGLHLEGNMGEVLEKLASRKAVVAVTDGIPRDRLMAFGGSADAHDPHVWFDVSMWAQCLPTVERAFAKAAPQHAADFASSRERHAKELAALDAEVRAAVATIPKERRVLVTAHDAFGYFGRAYDVEVLGVQGMSTESEASLADINALVETLVSRRVPAVFVESSVSPRNIEALRQGAASRGHTVRVGGSLFSDAMGAAGTPEGTYPGMVRHNVRTIVEALSH
ncbi:MAG TPA: zinc ABC transporter substrate-binding protein [Phycisphaerales bacterium]|nr:zinc ABC transporter substrate-binding protein [Phycisphaerales bacterium]